VALPAIDEAIALFALTLLLMFYVQPSLTRFGLFVTLIVTNLAILFAPAALFALLGHWRWRETFRLYAPRPPAVLAAIIVGLGAVPVVALLSGLQNKFWPPDEGTQRVTQEFILPTLQAHPFITPLVVGALAGIFEELPLRGPIQTAMMRRMSPWVAILVAAVLFAGAHLDLHGVTLRAVLGVLLGWIVWRTGSIVPAMIVHAAYDAGTLGLFAWLVHRHGVEGEPPLLDTPGAIRLAIGLILTALGLWVFSRSNPTGPNPPTAPPSLRSPPASRHRTGLNNTRPDRYTP
jgi:membrane protease YdiL (CAAX protease family)